jgi:hypothetical protein
VAARSEIDVPEITYPWPEAGEVCEELSKRHFSFRLDAKGCTISWDDPGLTEYHLRHGIADWLRETRERKAKRKARKTSQRAATPGQHETQHAQEPKV